MKKICLLLFNISIAGSIIFTSCKKELSCEGCIDGNKPPIANAGRDTTIVLPVDSVMLDGSASTDPDGTITSYKWIKIAGPVSSNISKPDSSKTSVKTLVAGVYKFELTVTDNGGLFSKDTVMITVNALPPPVTSSDNSTRQQVTSQLIPIGTLSKARAGMAVAAAGNKIVFAGGQSNGCTGSWCEDWGSSRVDIYDVSTNTWSTAELSAHRYGIAAIAVGNKIFFAGGESGDGAFNSLYSNVDIYDVSTNTWSVASLSLPRSSIAVAAIGNKIFFAGGEFNWNYDNTNLVDIYDVSTNTWSTSQLSEARASISAVTVNQKIYFAGGQKEDRFYANPSNRIDVYDNATNSWSTSALSIPMGFISGISVADKIYWNSGCTVEIKDVNTWSSSIAYLSKPGTSIFDLSQPVVKENKIIFFRKWDGGNKFDIYDIATNTWSIGVLPVGIDGASIISVNNTIYVAGGMLNSTGYFNPGDQVWKLEF